MLPVGTCQAADRAVGKIGLVRFREEANGLRLVLIGFPVAIRYA